GFDELRGSRSKEPADDRRQRFDHAEDHADAQCLAPAWARHPGALAQGRGEGIGGHGEAEQDDGNKGHGSRDGRDWADARTTGAPDRAYACGSLVSPTVRLRRHGRFRPSVLTDAPPGIGGRLLPKEIAVPAVRDGTRKYNRSA